MLLLSPPHLELLMLLSALAAIISVSLSSMPTEDTWVEQCIKAGSCGKSVPHVGLYVCQKGWPFTSDIKATHLRLGVEREERVHECRDINV